MFIDIQRSIDDEGQIINHTKKNCIVQSINDQSIRIVVRGLINGIVELQKCFFVIKKEFKSAVLIVPVDPGQTKSPEKIRE